MIFGRTRDILAKLPNRPSKLIGYKIIAMEELYYSDIGKFLESCGVEKGPNIGCIGYWKFGQIIFYINNKIAELIPTAVGIEVLNKYK